MENLGHSFEELWQAGGFELCRWLDLILKTQLEKTCKKIHLLLNISFKETKKLYYLYLWKQIEEQEEETVQPVI